MRNALAIMVAVFFLVAMMGAVIDSPAPAYHENLKVGGGYGDTTAGSTGGIDLDKEGNVKMDGDLAVDGTATIGDLNTPIAVSEDGEDAEFRASSYSATTAHAGVLTTRKGTGTEASPTIVVDNDVLGRWSSQGYDGDSWAEGARIEARVDGTPGDGDMPTELVFSTTPDGTETPVERVIISPAGLFTTILDAYIAGGDFRVGSAGAANYGTTDNPNQWQIIDTSNTKIEGSVGVGTAGAPAGKFEVVDTGTGLGGFLVSANSRIGTFSGLPSGSTVDAATLAVNPSGIGAANRYLFGVGVSNSTRFRVDVEGDTSQAGDSDILGGDHTVGVDSSVQGIITSWDGGSNEPGAFSNASGDGTLNWTWVTNSGCLRTDTSKPSADSDGVNLACPSSYASMGTHDVPANEYTLTIAAGDTWTKYDDVTNGGHEDPNDNANTDVANDKITIGADGGGDYKIACSISAEADGNGKLMFYGVAQDPNTPLALTSYTAVDPGVITKVDHGLQIGDSVIITGSSGGDIDGDNVVAAASFTADTFTLIDFAGATIDGGPGGTGGQVDTLVHWNLITHRYHATGADVGAVPITGSMTLSASDDVYVVILDRTAAASVDSIIQSLSLEIERVENGP